MAYTVHQAKTHFSRLLKEAEAGQEVVVMRGSKPVDKISWTEDAFDPMTDQELEECGMGYLLDAPLISPPTP
jgi:hypothetical protein